MSQGSRTARVGDQIRAELASLLARDVHDPGIGFVTLTEVHVSPDLQVARVRYTVLGDEKARESSARALDRATPFLRRQIGSRLRLRRTPELTFAYDDSVAGQDRIERILNDLHAADAARPANDRPTPPTMTKAPELQRVAEAIAERQRFVLSSHARPDGDAIGSQLAVAFALRQLGKEVRLVNADPVPSTMQTLPGVADIEVASRVSDSFDAAIVMECGDLARTGVAGLDRFFVVNIDHHPGNTSYGQINWFDPSAAACGEMAFDLVQALGVPLTLEIATHVYLAILTDTGSFHFSSISPRTFDICRQTLEAGVDPVLMARTLFDSNSMGRLKLFGAVLNTMRVDPTGRIALIGVDHGMALETGGTYEDTDGLINLPLTVKDIQAVIFFKEIAGDEHRVSMRSKGGVDVGDVARVFGGGGHKNAAGCTATGPVGALRELFVRKVQAAIDHAG